MNLYVTNPILDQQISDIRRKIRLSMNGVTSEQMNKMGIVYKQNFGVAIPRLREIGNSYTKNHDLAQRLWALNIRETKILATLLEPAESFTQVNAQKWIEETAQIELIEQLCMNLLCKLPYASKLSTDWIRSESTIKQIAGFILSARIYGQLTDEDVQAIVLEAIRKSDSDNLHLYKSIALALSRIAKRDRNTADKILYDIKTMENSDTKGQQYIWHEVKEEILFLNSL